MFGKKHSPETLEKMRKPKSQESRLKLSITTKKLASQNKLFCQSEEGRECFKQQALKKSKNGSHPWNNTISVFNLNTKRVERITKNEFELNREKYVGVNSKLKKETTNAIT